jgi:transposase-like protein
MLFVRHGDPMKPLTEKLNLAKLSEEFGTDEKCRLVIEKLRWPNGPECPRCQSKATPIANRDTFDCDKCHYQFSGTSGTIFHDSHLSLWKWFLTTFLLCEAKKGMSACQIQRTVGVSYKTAWYLCHRIRAAMLETNKAKLDGIVEIDETYFGGRAPRGQGYTGRYTPKQIVIGIRQRNGELRMFKAKDVKSGTLAQFIRENISEDVDIIMTDDFASYPFAMEPAGIPRTRHQTINHSGRVYVMGNVHTNTVESAFSLLKRGVMGTWHKVSAKHLPAYLDEMCFRFNNRKNPYLFRDTIIKLIQTQNLEYKNLTAHSAA